MVLMFTANEAPSRFGAGALPGAGVPRAEAPLEKSKLATLRCGAPSAAKTILAILGEILARPCPVLATSCLLIKMGVGQKSPQGSTSRHISELAPEDLMKLKVTLAANKEQPLSKVGAVVYVMTHEDTASSGANNIPNRKRMDFGICE